jgi:hypothetical protein
VPSFSFGGYWASSSDTLLQICVYRVRSFGSSYLLKLQLEAAKRKRKWQKKTERTNKGSGRVSWFDYGQLLLVCPVQWRAPQTAVWVICTGT